MKRKVYSDVPSFLADNAATGADLPFSADISVLGESLSVGTKTAPNRLACQAMEGCDGDADGRPGELTGRRYRRFAAGGAGIIWFEATAVMREGRANPRQLYITEENLDSFKKQVEEIKETALRERGHEPLVIMQATHSGRYSKPDGTPAPIIVKHDPLLEKDTPVDDGRIASDEYLDRVGEALVNGAVLAERAGFDGVDIKSCHRYLLSELLSANDRPGRYGGSFENRTRLLRESVKGAFAATGTGFIVTSRLNVCDGVPYPSGFGVTEDGSFDPAEPSLLVKELAGLGVKLLDITMGNPYFNPHVNRPFALGPYEPEEHPLLGVKRVLDGTSQIKKAAPGTALICSAISYLGVAAPGVVSAYIRDGGFDVAGFGREAIAYPDFAKDILDSGEMDVRKICLCCSKCTEIMRKPGGTPGCAVRDREVYLPVYRELCGRE
ncbi:MAG: flavin oxidoreductase/NADH oxidase [Clostridia bacterium]|nr:flavin oxidoreductase/NADH oxidase [Clostridia bacterium]